MERALMDLSLLVLRDYIERREPLLHTGDSFDKVTLAEKWLHDRLADNPSITEAAAVIGLSSSQLNRLFLQVREESPQQALHRLKIGRAMELLASSNAKLHSVAAESGLATASNLRRAFQASKDIARQPGAKNRP